MIDRIWERWAEKTAPIVARATAMLAASLDPECEGCRVEHQTRGRYFSGHTCAKWKMRQVLWAYDRARKKRRVAPTLEKLREELLRVQWIRAEVRKP